MPFEVEQKFRVASLQPTLNTIAQLGGEVNAPIRQVDCYYRHPQRDFAQTDEALRIRSVGERNCITYKGPKIDPHTKTRIEHEVALADGEQTRVNCAAIFGELGFKPVATVSKRRRTCELERGGLAIELALDEVDNVGEFVEIEISVAVDNSDDPAVEQARTVLAELASELGLSEVERRSYLELLLED